MPEPIQSGGCVCGACRFELAPGSRWCANSYAEQDRRELGAPYATWLGVRDDRLQWSSEALTWHPGEGRERGVCSACGTTLVVRSPAWPRQIHVNAATIDGGPWRRPSANLFADERPNWVAMDESLPGFGGAQGSEPVGDGAWQDTLGAAGEGIRLASPFDALELRDVLADVLSDMARNDMEHRLARRADGAVLLLERDHTVRAVVECRLWHDLTGRRGHTVIFEAGDPDDLTRLRTHLTERLGTSG